jgi:predicted HNH restriction endonuclease
MNHSKSSWASLINSIENTRDPRALYFKPTCVVAVCNLLDGGIDSIEALPAAKVVEEFDRLVSKVIPQKSGQGWMPMWHLMRDGAWICKKNGAPTQRDIFKIGKPRSKSETLNAVDTIDCTGQFGPLWRSEKSRQELKTMMCNLLLAELDADANLMGEFLSALNEAAEGQVTDQDLALISDGQATAVENYAKYRVHTRIERSASIPKEVKRIQGYSCLACGFNFETAYGELGKNYIEAHHVVPVSVSAGQEKQVNFLDDFLVLCANCHKMIHRLGEPWTRDRLDDLKAVLGVKVGRN